MLLCFAFAFAVGIAVASVSQTEWVQMFVLNHLSNSEVATLCLYLCASLLLKAQFAEQSLDQ